MQINTLNLLKSNVLSIRVFEEIAVKDVFGLFGKVVGAAFQRIALLRADFSLQVVLKMIFAGLNNHSSPPKVEFIAINLNLKDCVF